MDRINDLKSLAKAYAKTAPPTFIGYGNPNSDILIIGKECGFEPEEPSEESRVFNEITYYNNAASWTKFCDSPRDSNTIPDWKNVPPFREEWEKCFCPRFAFRGQLYTKRSQIGTSTTWYMYQKLIDLYLGKTRSDVDLLDFQDHSFITELNGYPMKRSRASLEVKQSVLSRSTGLLIEPFFSSFPLVIAACKGYVKQYHLDLKTMFPHSRIIIANQLSIMPRAEYIEDIANMMKGTESFYVI